MLSLDSMVENYKINFPDIQSSTFKKILWGDYYYNSETKKFSKRPQGTMRKRTFVEFILEPIYKIFSHTVGKDKDNL